MIAPRWVLIAFLLQCLLAKGEDFDINMWYSGTTSQSCDSLCSSYGLVCNAKQIMACNTYALMQQVVQKFGSYCLKGEGFYTYAPTYEVTLFVTQSLTYSMSKP